MAMKELLTHTPNLIILDLGLPDGDGKDFIKDVREFSQVPIIILSARYDERETTSSLDLGADDYIKKPFSVTELLARVRANLRRVKGIEAQTAEIMCDDIKINILTRIITLKDVELKLTPIEYDLLKYFILNANRTLTHSQILKEIWGVGYQNEMQYLRTYINLLRKKIEDNHTLPCYIKTEASIGYRFCCKSYERVSNGL
jgi:two-component system KDP operon response regulator KdpE